MTVQNESREATKELVEEHRRRIDSLDSNVIQLLANRFDASREIGGIKRELGLPALDHARWREVRGSRVVASISCGIPREFAERFFDLVHEFSVLLQHDILDDEDEDEATTR